MKKEKYHPYKIRLVQQLNEDDPDCRLQFCEIIMNLCNNNPHLAPDTCQVSTTGRQAGRQADNLTSICIKLQEGIGDNNREAAQRSVRPSLLQSWLGSLQTKHGEVLSKFVDDSANTSLDWAYAYHKIHEEHDKFGGQNNGFDDGKDGVGSIISDEFVQCTIGKRRLGAG
ncbi:unnamed protein product [Brassicogethes aeneus]|uniref:Uncharacterized protein n=1 Tax=Brassicogethes aeneus TaxID=1431903 RepID=A0A9P0AQD2_BRAAE|nr:unnamed protein product [Brassicogethes aeneus]